MISRKLAQGPGTGPPPSPTVSPSPIPSRIPSGYPSFQPSAVPTIPTGSPTSVPSAIPSGYPSFQPSAVPTGGPTSVPTLFPTSITLGGSKGTSILGVSIDGAMFNSPIGIILLIGVALLLFLFWFAFVVISKRIRNRCTRCTTYDDMNSSVSSDNENDEELSCFNSDCDLDDLHISIGDDDDDDSDDHDDENCRSSYGWSDTGEVTATSYCMGAQGALTPISFVSEASEFDSKLAFAVPVDYVDMNDDVESFVGSHKYVKYGGKGQQKQYSPGYTVGGINKVSVMRVKSPQSGLMGKSMVGPLPLAGQRDKFADAGEVITQQEVKTGDGQYMPTEEEEEEEEYGDGDDEYEGNDIENYYLSRSRNAFLGNRMRRVLERDQMHPRPLSKP